MPKLVFMFVVCVKHAVIMGIMSAYLCRAMWISVRAAFAVDRDGRERDAARPPFSPAPKPSEDSVLEPRAPNQVQQNLRNNVFERHARPQTKASCGTAS